VNVVESPKPNRSRKRVVWQALFVVALLSITYLLWLRSQPERITAISSSTFREEPYKVSGGNLFTFVYGSPYINNNPGIQVQSLRDHSTRMLVLVDPQHQFYRHLLGSGASTTITPCLWSVVGEELYYAVEARSKNGFSPNQMPTPYSPRSLNTFLMPTNHPAAEEIADQTRIVVPQAPLPVQDVQFRRISLQGEASKEVVALRGESFILIGSQVFWIRPAVEETAQVTQGRDLRTQRAWLETTAHSDLMLTSLADGTTRCIRHGIPRDAGLTRVETGVTWGEVLPYPERSTRFYARASDGSVHALKFLTGRYMRLLLEFEGRFYWTDIRKNEADESQFPSNREVLMSSNLDGGDQREILNQVDKRSLEKIALSLYHGTLYCRFNELPAQDTDPPRGLLCRLSPEKTDPIEIVRKMPAGTDTTFLCEEGYLYFVWQDPAHRFLPFFRAGSPPALYRIPLDH